MKRTKWYKYKNSETGHVIYSQPMPSEMTICEGETYYSDEMHRRSHMTRKERRRLHFYRNGRYCALSKTAGMTLLLDLFDAGGEYCDSIPLNMVR